MRAGGHDIERLRRKRPAPKPGIVHLGLGAFFRAFGAPFLEDAMAQGGGDWGVIGVSLRNPAIRDALAPQDWAYTAVSLDGAERTPRQIEVLSDVLVAPEDPEAVLAAMADPDIKIVSLTITEKGYCRLPSGNALDPAHPDIVRDLSAELPISAIGFLVRALARRRAAGIAPFTVLSCDNLPENGLTTQRIVGEFARRIDEGLAQWIDEHVCFPSTMVDRITPATTQDDRDALARDQGLCDAAPVFHEPFRQWVIEDRFVGASRPDFDKAGAVLTADVKPFEDMKLKMLNGAHSALAYLGYLGGHRTIFETISDPVYSAYVARLWREIIPAVDAPAGVDLSDYATQLQARFANPGIEHLTWQIAMDGSQKLPQRLLDTVSRNLAADRACDALFLAVAGWMRYASGTDEAGAAIDVRDPLARALFERSSAEEMPRAKALALLDMPEIFPKPLAAQISDQIGDAAEQIWNRGVRRAITR